MSAAQDGGPAFPQNETRCGNTVQDEHGQGGMSLRDWFAGQALAGLCANSRIAEKWDNPKPVPGEFANATALAAYQLADAMLAARAKGGCK